MAFSPVPRLCTAAQSDLSVEYCTGAKYKGHIEDNRRKGSGIFTWPNGSKYEGEFIDNRREGQGIQTWPDGSSYEGVFKDDLRHGQGTQSWSDGSKYVGRFFRDRRHGKGTYSWANGSSYQGCMYIDKRDGYGRYTYANGDSFQGLYRKDERFGPGILTYTDGKQDAGFWLGDKLIKLLSAVSDSFSMYQHQDLGYDPNDHVEYVYLEDRLRNRRSTVDSILRPPSAYRYSENIPTQEQSNKIFSDSLHTDSVAMDCEVFENALFGELIGDIKKTKAVVWNGTPLMLEMQKHIHRFRSMESDVPFNPCNFRRGPRSIFASQPGPLEERSRDLISAAARGDVPTLQNLLYSGTVSPDVADANGFTALQAAVMNCRKETVNLLLDSGADINKLSDEGMSALAQSLVFYYPSESFKENVAEEEYLISKASGTASMVSATSLNLKPSYLFPEMTSIENIKPTSGYNRDSGFESRKDYNDPLDSGLRLLAPKPAAPKKVKEGDSPAITPVSQDTPVPGITEGGSSLSTPAPSQRVAESERDKSPSVISQITVTHNNKPVAENNLDDISNAEDGDDMSIISSQALSQASPVRPAEDFRSDSTVMNYDIAVNDSLIDRCATALSHNDMVTKRDDSATSVERSRILAKRKAMKQERWTTIQLLLRRGANPNACIVPMPALVFTIKAGDMQATKLMLLKEADSNLRLPAKKGGLSPLHLAAATPGSEGILITSCLLDALCDPDSRAAPDRSYLDPEEDWIKNPTIGADCCGLAGGRTPLHIVCSRSDDHTNSAMVVRQLLQHKANPNVLCNGHSPLSLAIISGNDLAITELLQYGADPSLTLTHGNGNALCVASHTAYEHRRTPEERIALIDQLVAAGADILAQIPIGPKKVMGTALDYAYHIFNLDRRIAHMPYHALSYSERETYNARRKLLAHMGDVVRVKCMERERQRLDEERESGAKYDIVRRWLGAAQTASQLTPKSSKEDAARSPSARFLYTGAGAKDGHVTFEAEKSDSIMPSVRRPLFKYCYECGRSINVRLTPCTRCKEVYFCSKNCKVRAWNARHKDECIRLQEAKGSGRTTKGAKSAPAKMGRGKGMVDMAKVKGKSYNLNYRPTDRILVPRRGLSYSNPNLRGKQTVRHGRFGGRSSPDLTPNVPYTDNYSFE